MFFIAVLAVSSFSWKSAAFRLMAVSKTAMLPNMLALIKAPMTIHAVQRTS